MGAAASKRRYIRIRSTGWGFIIILIPVLLAAWNTGANLLYIVVGGLFSFLALSVVFAFFVLREINVERSAPKAAYRCRPFHVHLRVENRRRWLSAYSVRIERVNRIDKPLGYILRIPAGQAARLAVEEQYDQRGVFCLPPYRLVSNFPFGLIESCCEFSDVREILVYPRVHPVRSNALERVPSATQASTQPNDDGDEFFALREYVQGDDIRRIVWRISARMGKWIVREMAHYNSRMVVLALDTTYCAHVDEFSENFEDAVELTASVATMLLRRRHEVSIVTPDDYLPGGDGKGHESHVLRMLARVNVSDGSHAFADKIASLQGMDSTIMYISPDPSKWGASNGHGRVLDPRELVHG